MKRKMKYNPIEWLHISLILILLALILLIIGNIIESENDFHNHAFITAVFIFILLFLIGYLILHKVYKPLVQIVSHIEEKLEPWEKNHTSKLKDQNFSNVDEVIDYFFDESQSLMMKEKNAELLMKTAEINNLQDQMNPHFLYNTLEVIRGQAMLKGDTEVADMTTALANYFRYNISRNNAFVQLKDELKNIDNYFTIQKYRFGDKINFRIIFQNEDQATLEKCFVPKLILQPIAENSIYHGLELKVGKGTLTIRISSEDNHLLISVEDDGVGMSPAALQQLKQQIINNDKPSEHSFHKQRNNGTALTNIYKRLKLYWGDSAYMVITSVQDFGTEIHLAFPIIFNYEDAIK